MPFWNRKSKEETRSEETTTTTETLTPEVTGDLLKALLSRTSVTRDMAMMIPAFAACVNIITETVASVPIKLYRRTADGVEEVTDDDRTRLINDDTNDTLSGVEFKRAMVRDYLLGKGGYAYINRRGKTWRSLNYVEEGYVSFLVNTDPIFKDYKIQIMGVEYAPYKFLKVLRNTREGHSGTSIIEENQDALGVAYNTMVLDGNLAKTGGAKRGFIESDRTLDKDSIETLKSQWKNLYASNSEDTVVILNRGLKFQDSSSTSTELQLNENKKTNSDDICKLFAMPPNILNGGASEDERIQFIQYCINPILDEFTCSLNRDMLLESEKRTLYFAADTSEFTKGDIDKRYNAYATGIKNGFMQIDEVREKENLAPLGIDFIKFGLQDVFYDKDTGMFYTPNMNQSGKMGEETDPNAGEGEKGGGTDES